MTPSLCIDSPQYLVPCPVKKHYSASFSPEPVHYPSRTHFPLKTPVSSPPFSPLQDLRVLETLIWHWMQTALTRNVMRWSLNLAIPFCRSTAWIQISPEWQGGTQEAFEEFHEWEEKQKRQTIPQSKQGVQKILRVWSTNSYSPQNTWESVPDAGMHVNRSAPAHIHAIPSRARAGVRVREERWRGRSRSCARWREELWRIEMERWRDGGSEGGGRKPKTDRQRGIRSEKEGGGEKKRHKAQNRGQCN